MQYYVAKGAPYLALDLYDIEEMKIKGDLPMPNTKTTKKISERVTRLLSNAAKKDEILTECSSTHSTSSRTSIVDFPF